MKRNKSFMFFFSVLILAALACNLPSTQPAVAPPPADDSGGDVDADATMTSIALTQAALQNQPAGGDQPPASTATITMTPTITPTGTPTVPMVSVSLDTNCRTGPGVIYDYLTALLVGEKAEVVGKYTTVSPSYWVIKKGSYTCWLWGKYATVEGDISKVPEMVPPPSPTPSPTATPTVIPFTVTSVSYTLSTWGDAGHTNCPRIIASITTNGAGTVKYKWKRKDTPGGGGTQSLTFASAGTQTVNYDWARGSVWAGDPTWVSIYVEDPNNQDFSQINFDAACTTP